MTRAWAIALGVVCVALLAGCAVETVSDDGAAELSAEGSPQDQVLSSADDPASFCDDQNPCTKDIDCTPCSSLPASERDIYHCTADADLPAACAMRVGCVHVPWTTPADQTDDCFPVAGADDLRSGVCRAGVCSVNPPI